MFILYHGTIKIYNISSNINSCVNAHRHVFDKLLYCGTEAVGHLKREWPSAEKSGPDMIGPDHYILFIGAIRLRGSTSDRAEREGRVEILHEGVWGTICNNGFEDSIAVVLCRMYGYSDGITVNDAAHVFGQGTGPIHLDTVHCSGQEYDIRECSFPGFGVHTCNHSQDAGIRCFNNDL